MARAASPEAAVAVQALRRTTSKIALTFIPSIVPRCAWKSVRNWDWLWLCKYISWLPIPPLGQQCAVDSSISGRASLIRIVPDGTACKLLMALLRGDFGAYVTGVLLAPRQRD